MSLAVLRSRFTQLYATAARLVSGGASQVPGTAPAPADLRPFTDPRPIETNCFAIGVTVSG